MSGPKDQGWKSEIFQNWAVRKTPSETRFSGRTISEVHRRSVGLCGKRFVSVPGRRPHTGPPFFLCALGEVEGLPVSLPAPPADEAQPGEGREEQGQRGGQGDDGNGGVHSVEINYESTSRTSRDGDGAI